MSKTRVIGLDIGTSAVRAVELEFSGRGRVRSAPVLHKFGQVSLPPGAIQDAEVAEPQTVATALRQLWKQTSFSTRDVVIGVGNARVAVRELDLPMLPLPQLRASLPFQVQELLPMPVDDAFLDFLPTGEVDGPAGRMVHGLLVAATRATVQSNVMAVESAGLRPQMVDLNAFALLRAVGSAEQERVIAVVDIGARVTTVVVSARGVPRLVRTVATGGQDVTDALAGHMSIATPDAEVLKREIGIGYHLSPELQVGAAAVADVTRGLVDSVRNTFVYFQGNNPGSAIDVVFLTGGGSHLPGIGQYLATVCRLPVSVGDPLAGVRIGGDAPKQLPPPSALAVPIGLAYGVAA